MGAGQGADLLEGVVGVAADGEHLVAGPEHREERARDGVRPGEALHPHQGLRTGGGKSHGPERGTLRGYSIKDASMRTRRINFYDALACSAPKSSA